MREGTTRQGLHRPGAEHWRQAEFDHRPAQVYAQAMAAFRVQRIGGFAAILSRFAGSRRPKR